MEIASGPGRSRSPYLLAYHSINNIIIHIVSDIPFSLLKVDHTVWDECPMSCTCACTLTSRIQVFPMDVAVILRPVVTAFRFLGTCQLINSLYSCKNSRVASAVHGLNDPHRAPVLPQIVHHRTVKHRPQVVSFLDGPISY